MFDGGTLPNIFTVIARRLSSLYRDGRTSPLRPASHGSSSVLSLDVRIAAMVAPARSKRTMLEREDFQRDEPRPRSGTGSSASQDRGSRLDGGVYARVWQWDRALRNHSRLGHGPSRGGRSAASGRHRRTRVPHGTSATSKLGTSLSSSSALETREKTLAFLEENCANEDDVYPLVFHVPWRMRSARVLGEDGKSTANNRREKRG